MGKPAAAVRLSSGLCATDAQREWFYDRRSRTGKLDRALAHVLRTGWTMLDLQKDWKTVLPRMAVDADKLRRLGVAARCESGGGTRHVTRFNGG